MKSGSYHDTILNFLKANPGKLFTAKQLARIAEPTFAEIDLKKVGMNNVMKEIMFRHSPHVHQANTRSEGSRLCWHYWFNDATRNSTFIVTGGPGFERPADPLQEHFKKMQDMAQRYLMPEPYIDRDGNSSKVAIGSDKPVRDAMFANDMLYMLDGPGQRAAQERAA